MPGGDGRGPRQGSYQRSKTGSKGKRQLAGQRCPMKSKKK